MEATAYSYNGETIGVGYLTATVQNLQGQSMVAAVDPTVIPLGIKLFIEG